MDFMQNQIRDLKSKNWEESQRSKELETQLAEETDLLAIEVSIYLSNIP
jgi:hypothetical protein